MFNYKINLRSKTNNVFPVSHAPLHSQTSIQIFVSIRELNLRLNVEGGGAIDQYLVGSKKQTKPRNFLCEIINTA